MSTLTAALRTYGKKARTEAERPTRSPCRSPAKSVALTSTLTSLPRTGPWSSDRLAPPTASGGLQAHHPKTVPLSIALMTSCVEALKGGKTLPCMPSWGLCLRSAGCLTGMLPESNEGASVRASLKSIKYEINASGCN